MRKWLGETTTGERATQFVQFTFCFSVVIMKLLEIFVPRGMPLYQDEFSYHKNVFSSNDIRHKYWRFV